MGLREIAKLLNYKQAVVLSHMSLGRVPIPIDRAEQIAEVLGMDSASFLRAVVEQRHPKVTWELLGDMRRDLRVASDPLPEELEVILGKSLRDLSASQRRVMREIVNDEQCARRWLTLEELPVFELLRQWRPEMAESGLAGTDRTALKTFLFEQAVETRRN